MTLKDFEKLKEFEKTKHFEYWTKHTKKLCLIKDVAREYKMDVVFDLRERVYKLVGKGVSYPLEGAPFVYWDEDEMRDFVLSYRKENDIQLGSDEQNKGKNKI